MQEEKATLIRVRKLVPEAVMPTKAHASDAGYDITATSRVFDEIGNVVYGTGIAIEIPDGFVGLIFPRSSLSRYDLMLSNAVGVIYSGYRGEITFKMRPSLIYCDVNGIGISSTDYAGSKQEDPNTQFVTMHGRQDFYRMSRMAQRDRATLDPRIYEVGDRIGQLIIVKLPDTRLTLADTLSDSERGTGGYGSTGR